MASQIEMVSLEDLLPASHQYRKFMKIFDFKAISPELKKQTLKQAKNSVTFVRSILHSLAILPGLRSTW